MTSLSATDGWEAMQPMFLVMPANRAMQQSACAYWIDQEKILQSTQEFVTDWFERRHADTRAGLETARRVCEAESPMDMLQSIRRLSETSTRALGWGLILSVAVALWSANAGTQAMFAALNIAYEEPERRSLLRYYLSAFTSR